MKYFKKIFPVFLLSGSIIFAGISLSPSAQGATATVSSLQKEIVSIKKEIVSLKKDIREVGACSTRNTEEHLKQLISLAQTGKLEGYGIGNEHC